MKRALIQRPGEVVLDEAPAPEAGGDRYLIAVGACGLCTWEQRAYRGVSGPHPFAPGHEVGGVVVGGPSQGLAAGTLVAVSLLPRCGRCSACMSGLDNLCAYLGETGAGEGPGGLSEYLVAEPRDVQPLPQGRTPLEAALVEPLGCVLNSLHVAEVGEGTRLAVLGNGFMGVLHARAAAACGAEVTLLETSPRPLGLEDAWQGRSADLDLENSSLQSRAPTAGDGEFDAVIVIRGLPASLRAAAHLARPGGIVSLYASLAGSEDVCLPGHLLRRKQLTLTAAASHRAVDFEEAAVAVGSGAVIVLDLVHRSYPLERFEEAIAYASEADTGRVLVTLGGAPSQEVDDAGG